MAKDWIGITKSIGASLRELRAGTPDVMRAFAEMAQAALAPKALDTKTKELIALAIGVSTRCDDCIAFHAKAAAEQGASSAEISETLAMAIYMGAGPSVMYAAHAIDAYKAFAESQGEKPRAIQAAAT